MCLKKLLKIIESTDNVSEVQSLIDRGVNLNNEHLREEDISISYNFDLNR